MRVLLIEDDADLSAAIATMLERERYAVDVAHDGDAGLDRLLSGSYAAAVIDIGLPKRDGFSICAAARGEHIDTPLLVLSARDGVEDRIRGLDVGADDYLVKPFSHEELAARLRALLRRGDRPQLPLTLSVGSLSLDSRARTVVIGTVPLVLGATEFRLLELLVRNRGVTLSRTHILEKICDYDFHGSTNLVDVYVSHLRRKLKSLGANATIATVWGVGYKLDEITSSDAPSSG